MAVKRKTAAAAHHHPYRQHSHRLPLLTLVTPIVSIFCMMRVGGATNPKCLQRSFWSDDGQEFGGLHHFFLKKKRAGEATEAIRQRSTTHHLLFIGTSDVLVWPGSVILDRERQRSSLLTETAAKKEQRSQKVLVKFFDICNNRQEVIKMTKSSPNNHSDGET